MSHLVYDHTQLVEPNLLIPGKKPIGPVRIDWSHPATINMKECYLFQRNYKALGIDSAFTSNPAGSTPWVGDSVRIDSKSSVNNELVNLNPVDGGMGGYRHAFVIIKFTPTVIVKNDLLLMWDVGNYHTGISIFPDNVGSFTLNTNCLSIGLNHSRVETDTDSIAAGKEITVVILWHGFSDGNTIRVFINGKLVSDSYAVDYNKSTLLPTNSVRLGGSGLDEFNGIVDMFAWGGSADSDGIIMPEEIGKDISKDPYQFLIPAG